MKYGRIIWQGAFHYVRSEGEEVVLLAGPPWGAADCVGQAQETGTRLAVSEVVWAPVSDASKVVAVGLNYRKHAEEMGKSIPLEPLVFLKPASSLNAHQQTIKLPPESQQVEHEAELALVIGKRIGRGQEGEATHSLFGYTCFNDVTARDLQRKDVQYTRAKGFDTFSCVGPWIETDLNPNRLSLICRVNGKVRQNGNTSDMIIDPVSLVASLARMMTLMPGDLVITGTPSGVGRLEAGDTVEVEIEGIGTLRNGVEDWT